MIAHAQARGPAVRAGRVGRAGSTAAVAPELLRAARIGPPAAAARPVPSPRRVLDRHLRRGVTPLAAASSGASGSPRFDPRPALASTATRVRASASDGAALLAAAHAALKTSAAPVIAAFAAADALTFLIHRCGHRVTNALAMAVLPGVRAAVDGAAASGGGGGGILNPWWLTNDPAIANFASGYQWLVLLLFLAVFPLNVAVRSAAASAAAFLTDGARSRGGGGDTTTPATPTTPKPTLRSRAGAAAASLASVAPAVRAAFTRVVAVDLAVAVRALPLQAACLAVLPLPWALPRLLDLQVAGAVAALEGAPGDLALDRAARLTRGRRGALAWPYVGLLVAGRVVAAVRAASLAALPPRIVAGVPELALALWALGLAASVWVARLGDVLPIVARERWAAAAAGGGGPPPAPALPRDGNDGAFPRNPWLHGGRDVTPAPASAAATPPPTTASVALSRVWGVAIRPATAAAAARASALARGGLRPRGPLSALVVLAALAAALLSGVRALLRAATPGKACATCAGFGLQRCPMCGGAGALGGSAAGAFRGGAPCPRCLGRRGVACEECGGGGLAAAWVTGRRPLFAHAGAPRVGAAPGLGVAAARRLSAAGGGGGQGAAGATAAAAAAASAAVPASRLARWRDALRRRRRSSSSSASSASEEELGEHQLRTLYD